MAKGRTRKTGYDRVVTENGDGSCEWTAGGWQWYYLCTPGINLQVKIGEEYKPINYAKSLADAGLFAEGFHAGALIARQLLEAERRETDALVADQPDAPKGGE